jgi:hypothetical protein
MRIIDEIPHELFKINVFNWNSKFILKIELDNFEQHFKISEDAVKGPEDIRKILNDAFLDEVFKNFLNMRSAFQQSFQLIQTN